MKSSIAGVIMILEILMAGQSWSQNIPDYKKCLENPDKEVAAICLISTGNAYGEKGRYKEKDKVSGLHY